MYVKELWRYPVKSLGGERVEQCSVGELGLTGDRIVLVQGPAGGSLPLALIRSC